MDDMLEISSNTTNMTTIAYELEVGLTNAIDAVLRQLAWVVSYLYEQATNMIENHLLARMIIMLRSLVAFVHDAYVAQMTYTPLTMKACLVLAALIVFVMAAVTLRRHTSVSVVSARAYPDKPSVTSVFNMAKRAYKPGNVDYVIRMVKSGYIDVNAVMPTTGLSLLLCACLGGQRKLIRFLLFEGACIKQQTRDGDSCLYLATFGVVGQSPASDASLIIQDLIDAGCDVNAKNKKGFTALHRAASKGHVPVIQTLLDNGADPYQTTSSGIYPIDLAINADHLEAAELLAIKLDDPHVWEVVEPHTPSRIRLGLMSPRRQHLLESTAGRPNSGIRIKAER